MRMKSKEYGAIRDQLSIGVDFNPGSPHYTEAVNSANLKLVALGHTPVGDVEANPGIRLGGFLIHSYQ